MTASAQIDGQCAASCQASATASSSCTKAPVSCGVQGYGGAGADVQLAIDKHLPNILALTYGQASAASSACATLGSTGGGAGVYGVDGSVDKGAACTQVAHDSVNQSQATVGGAAQAGASVAIACGVHGSGGGGGGYGSTGGGCTSTGDAGVGTSMEAGADTGTPSDTAL